LQDSNNPDSRLISEIDVLINQAVNGDAESFGRLYDIYADRIYHQIYYRTNSVEDARDLTQEVFVKAWQALAKYKRTKTPFLGWLFTISHNRVIDYYRTKKDHLYLNQEIDLPEFQSTNPESMAEARFTQQQIRLILMSFIEGLDYREIAAALQKSEGNIRVMVHRALKKMKLFLDREEV
jgi:RNA polymerase sigma-70 factor (ECF subfamily)